MKKRLAIFGGNNLTREIKKYAKKNEIILVSFGYDTKAEIHKISDEQCFVDCTDSTIMPSLLKEKAIDGIFSCTGELVIRKSIDYISQLNYSYYCTPKQWEIIMNKQNFKHYSKNFGVPSVPEFNNDMKFPIIVKPVDAAGSEGISICNTREELNDALDFAKNSSISGDIICEKFLVGDFFQFDICFQDGKYYVPYTKDRVFYPSHNNHPEQPYVDIYPSKNETLLKEYLYEPLYKMFTTLGVKNGTCLFQGIVEDGIPYIIDTNFRLGGSMDYKSVEREKNVDIIGCYMQFALSGKFGDDISSLDKPYKKFYATISIGIKNGSISKISGIEEIKSLPYVFDFYQYYFEGDKMTKAGYYAQSICRIFIFGKDKNELNSRIEVVSNLIEVYDENGNSMLFDYPNYQ